MPIIVLPITVLLGIQPLSLERYFCKIYRKKRNIQKCKQCLSVSGGIIKDHAAAAAKSLQLCPTLCHPIDSSPPGSPVSGILQARTLEWVAISFSNAWKWKVKVKSLSCVWLLVTLWTAAHQAPPSMGFSRQVFLSGVPLPSPMKDHKRSLFLHSFLYITIF